MFYQTLVKTVFADLAPPALLPEGEQACTRLAYEVDELVTRLARYAAALASELAAYAVAVQALDHPFDPPRCPVAESAGAVARVREMHQELATKREMLFVLVQAVLGVAGGRALRAYAERAQEVVREAQAAQGAA